MIIDENPRGKVYKSISVDGCEIIGQGARGTVYRYKDGRAVKVYKNDYKLSEILNERNLARRAFALGIPTAMSYDVVKVGDNYGSVFELLDAKTYSRVISDDPENIDIYLNDYVSLLKKIHSTAVKEYDMPDIKVFVKDWLDTLSGYLDSEYIQKLSDMIESVPDTMNMLHCDYHTNNVMRQNGKTFLIDMDTLSHGHPVFEFANMFVTYMGLGESTPEVVEDFLGIPYNTAKYIWKRSIQMYFNTDDAEFTASIENKAAVLGYLRMFRYYIRNGSIDAANSIIYKITELLKNTDALDF